MYIQVKTGSVNLSVDLRLDLGLYCKIAKPLCLGLVASDQDIPQEIKEAYPLGFPASAPISYKQGFEAARAILEGQLYQLVGATQWFEIEKLLVAQCVSIKLDEAICPAKKPFTILGNENTPLAILAMRDHFIELLKNSMDSIIENYLNAKGETTVLEMNVAVQIKDEKIIIIVSDNAGGFSPAYIQYFSHCLPEKTKNWSSEKDKKKYLFGGNGFALEQLYEFVAAGGDGGESSINTASMEIANSEIGAKITITTLLKPCVPSDELFSKKRRKNLDLDLHDAQQHLFFQLSSSLPRKRSKVVAVDPPKPLAEIIMGCDI